MNPTHKPHHRLGGPKPKPRKPTPAPGRPPRPAGLDAIAGKHWDMVLDLVAAAGLLSLLDADSLKIYIDAWTRYHKARRICERDGYVIEGLYGPNKSAWYTIMMEAAAVCRAYGDRFGLTPLGRQRLKIDPMPADPDNKWAAFGVVGE